MTGRRISLVSFLFFAATTLATRGAWAQEPVGAGHIELESAVFGGGALFTQGAGAHATGYILNVAATGNLNRKLGIEGDFAWAMTRRQTLSLFGVGSPNQRTPNMLFYTGNLVYSPGGHDHKFVPYVEAGGGAVSVLDTAETGAFGLAAHSTHLVGNVGVGLRWFPVLHWGFRADYRYIGIRNPNPPETLGVAGVHHAQRLYGGLVFTF